MLDFSEGATPLYTQLAQDILRRISSGEFSLGSYLPSQNELCSEYGVSRITAIKALEILRNQSIISCQRGKGSQVVSQNIDNKAFVIDGFSSQFSKRGFVTSTRVLSSSVVPCTEAVASVLMLESGESVIELKRIRLIENTPVCFECTYYPDGDVISDICLNIRDNESVYSRFRKAGLSPSYAEETMSTISSSPECSSILSVAEGTPLLRIKRKTFFEGMKAPLEYCVNHYNSETYGEYGIVTIKFQSRKEE